MRKQITSVRSYPNLLKNVSAVLMVKANNGESGRMSGGSRGATRKKARKSRNLPSRFGITFV
jgi:hypothetical protein